MNVLLIDYPMKIRPLSKRDITMMRRAGAHAARTLNHVGRYVQAGVTTEELDQIVLEHTLTTGGRPATLHYLGFPKSCCTSLNDIICHGVPDETVLKNGDILNVDVTTCLDGYYGDTSRMFVVGGEEQASPEALKIIDMAYQAQERGIEMVRAGATTGDIGHAIEEITKKSGFYVVKEIGGHGIGKKFHQDPFVPSFGNRRAGTVLPKHCCITIEPMVNETESPILNEPIPHSKHFVYRTGDGRLSAQFEHTVLVTKEGCEILTVA